MSYEKFAYHVFWKTIHQKIMPLRNYHGVVRVGKHGWKAVAGDLDFFDPWFNFPYNTTDEEGQNLHAIAYNALVEIFGLNLPLNDVRHMDGEIVECVYCGVELAYPEAEANAYRISHFKGSVLYEGD